MGKYRTHYELRNLILKRMGYESYGEYLGSPLWKSIRQRCFESMGSFCYVCGSKIQLQIHHQKYTERNLAGYTLQYLKVVCKVCHEAAEVGKSGKKRPICGANDALARAAKANNIGGMCPPAKSTAGSRADPALPASERRAQCWPRLPA